MKFKHDIEAQAGFKDKDGQLGSAGQILTSTGSQTDWVDQSTINAGNAEHVVIYAKNTSGASISKGTPVYITGTVGATDTVQIAPADAGDSAKMPAVGLLDDTLANNAFGYVITGGFMDNITTDPIDGATPSSNDTVYVKVGGGLTLTKPTGPTGLIQNIAKVGKVSGGNSGSLIVSSILRTNDVPNLTTGKIWVGDGNTTESTVVHLDETNGRMGIGTASPAEKLEVSGSIKSGNLIIEPSNGGRIGLNRNTSTGAIYNNSYGAFQLQNNGTGFFELQSYNSSGGYTGVLSMLESNGNVGIGTTSPGQKLHVNGTTYSTSGYKLNSGFSIGAIGYNSAIRFNNGNILVNNSSSAEFVRFDAANSRVGIGTTSPTEKLFVNGGNAKIENTGTTYLKLNSNTSFPSVQIQAERQGGASPPMGQLRWDQNPGATGMQLVYWNSYTENSLKLDGSNFKVINNGSERMRIDSSGNVGIGTTSPLARLDVDGTSYFKGDFYSAKTGSIGTSNMIEAKVAGTSNGDALIKIGDVNDYWGGSGSYSQWNTTDKTLIHGVDVGINVDPKNMLHLFKGNLFLESSGIRDANGDYGAAGQNLKSKGQGTVEWSWEKMTLVSTFYASSFQSGSVIYMPVNGTTGEQTTNQYYNNFVAPYNGRVRQIRIKHISGSTPTATSFSSFRVYVNGSLTGNITPTTTDGGLNGMMGVAEYSDTAATFSAGDRVQFAYVASGSTGHIYGATATFIIEYTENS